MFRGEFVNVSLLCWDFVYFFRGSVCQSSRIVSA